MTSNNQHPATEQIAKVLHQFCLAHPIEDCPACKIRLREVLAIIGADQESVRTEYGIRYTSYRHGQGKTKTIVEPLDAINRAEAEQSRDATREWQATTEGQLPVDAEIVTRTVTTTEWA